MALLRLLVLVAGGILQTSDPRTDPYSRAFDNCFPAVRVAAGGLGPDAMDMEAKENDT